MKVKALKPHMNGYGDKFEKAKGDEYEIPDVHAAPLIAAKLAADVNAAPKELGDKSGDNGAGG
ncbi:MAG: hypothetical protein WC803_08785 [Sphingomonas sp.]|jgi:hypothetical protein